MLKSIPRRVCVVCSSWNRPTLNWGNEDRNMVTFSAPVKPGSTGKRNCNRTQQDSALRRASFSDLLTSPLVFYLTSQEYASRSMNKEPKSKKGGKPKVNLSDEELSQIINIEGFRAHLNSTVERMRDDFVKQLSLRTSAGAFETLTVDFDGEKYSLNEVGQISRKNPNLIVINMSALPDAIRSVIEAIQKSGMNLNPQQEGTTIYVPLPQLTREHRENLSKNAKILFNQTKDDLKDVQTRIIKSIKGKKGSFSDDLIFDSQLQVIAITDSYVSQAEELLLKKQTELLGKE